MLAASLLTSVPACPMAIPISADFRATASLTPSPVIDTTAPALCRACGGEERRDSEARRREVLLAIAGHWTELLHSVECRLLVNTKHYLHLPNDPGEVCTNDIVVSSANALALVFWSSKFELILSWETRSLTQLLRPTLCLIFARFTMDLRNFQYLYDF